MADLTFYRGNNAVTNVTVTNPDNTPMKLGAIQGATFLAKVDVRDRDEQAVVVKTLGSGITVTDADNGKLQIAMDRADTAGTRDALVYALNITSALGEEKTVASGRVIFIRTGNLGKG